MPIPIRSGAMAILVRTSLYGTVEPLHHNRLWSRPSSTRDVDRLHHRSSIGVNSPQGKPTGSYGDRRKGGLWSDRRETLWIVAVVHNNSGRGDESRQSLEKLVWNLANLG